MKVYSLNQTALVVHWDRPATIFHPPIVSFMVSYSWVKDDVPYERTFTKTGDDNTVSLAGMPLFVVMRMLFYYAFVLFCRPPPPPIQLAFLLGPVFSGLCC